MRVRPLEWTGARAADARHYRPYDEAETPWGVYRVEWWDGKPGAWLYGPGNVAMGTGEMLVGGFHNVEDAKRGAYEDYCGRIGTVIETQEEMRHAA
jgi:hypothetical protein